MSTTSRHTGKPRACDDALRTVAAHRWSTAALLNDYGLGKRAGRTIVVHSLLVPGLVPPAAITFARISTVLICSPVGAGARPARFLAKGFFRRRRRAGVGAAFSRAGRPDPVVRGGCPPIYFRKRITAWDGAAPKPAFAIVRPTRAPAPPMRLQGTRALLSAGAAREGRLERGADHRPRPAPRALNA